MFSIEPIKNSPSGTYTSGILSFSDKTMDPIPRVASTVGAIWLEVGSGVNVSVTSFSAIRTVLVGLLRTGVVDITTGVTIITCSVGTSSDEDEMIFLSWAEMATHTITIRINTRPMISGTLELFRCGECTGNVDGTGRDTFCISLE